MEIAGITNVAEAFACSRRVRITQRLHARFAGLENARVGPTGPLPPRVTLASQSAAQAAHTCLLRTPQHSRAPVSPLVRRVGRPRSRVGFPPTYCALCVSRACLRALCAGRYRSCAMPARVTICIDAKRDTFRCFSKFGPKSHIGLSPHRENVTSELERATA